MSQHASSCSLLFVFILTANALGNVRKMVPVIGIISSDEPYINFSVIKNTYVEFIESSGAQVIPIPWNIEEQKFKTILKSINGVLFTGGSALLWTDFQGVPSRTSSPFQKKLELALEIAMEQNAKGINYPLYAICQGLESIGIAVTHDPYLMDNYTHFFAMDKVYPTDQAKGSRLFSYFDDRLLNFIQTNDAMFYYHQYGINTSVPQLYPAFGPTEYKVTAIGYDIYGKSFINAAEHSRYPIMMHQFHPERILYEYMHNLSSGINPLAADVGRALSKALFNEAHKNGNSFEVTELRNSLLIENFNLEFVQAPTLYGKYYTLNSTSLDKIWEDAYQRDANNNSTSIFLIVIMVALIVYIKSKKSERLAHHEEGRYFELKTIKS